MVESIEIMNEFVKECKKKLNLKCIIQFGSSTYSNNPKDIDLVFFSNNLVFSSKDYIKLFDIIKEFEKRHSEVVFDIGSGKRNRKAKYEISIVPLQELDLLLNIDAFLLKNLIDDKNKKILYGKNILPSEIQISKKYIIRRLTLNANWGLRNCLDDKSTKFNSIYHMFKVALRLMLINKRVPKKEELLSLFIRKYPKIKLPKNSNKIINNKISNEDLEDVLKFYEDCLNYMHKSKKW
jgi:hypothetical protein